MRFIRNTATEIGCKFLKYMFCGFDIFSKYQDQNRNFPHSTMSRDSQSTAVRFHDNLGDFWNSFLSFTGVKMKPLHFFPKMCANPKTSFF